MVQAIINKPEHAPGTVKERKTYALLPTIQMFHRSPAYLRAIVGPVGSGKTTAAAFEAVWYVPRQLFKQYGIIKTRWVIVRNTYCELRDTTQRTVFEWFPQGQEHKQENTYLLTWDYQGRTLEVELMFRSCDRPEDRKKFKSLEITGYWIDESIEVGEDIKRMLKSRIGRFPPRCPVRYGIETTNPPDVEHLLFSDFRWIVRPPEGSPWPAGQPLPDHEGFWQPPRENIANLRPRYYEDLENDYRDSPDWIATYIKSLPGMIVRGKPVWNNFRSALHVGQESLIWSKGPLIRGWDNSGNCPACVVVQVPTARRLQVLREFTTEREGIVDFCKRVVWSCNEAFPGATYTDWADPAGAAKFSRREGGFTSNAELMEEACGVQVQSSDQNLTARINSVDQLFREIDGILIDPGCIRLINACAGGYCYAEIGTTGRYAENPEKNKYAHVAEALQYVAVKLALSSVPKSDKVYHVHRRKPGATSWMGA